MDKNECPHCGADLTAEEIPQHLRDKGYYGDSTHYSRIIGVEVPDVYDGTLYYSCPNCGLAWVRAWTNPEDPWRIVQGG